MGYSSSYKKRMESKGLSGFDRTVRAKKRQFEQYFENSITKEIVEIDGIKQEASFQDQNQNNNKDLSDDKYIVTRFDSNLATGAQVYWKDKFWLVFSVENKTAETHKQGKIRATNHQIKWMVGNKICGNGNGYPAYVQNNTLYTLGVSTSGQNAWIVNAKYGMFMKDSEEARMIKIGQRVFIGGNVYQVMFKDYVARRGLISFLLEEDFFNPTRDDAEIGIANYYDIIKEDETPAVTTGVNKELVVSGSDNAKIGSTMTYTAKTLQDGVEVESDISEWTLSDVDRACTIVEQNSRSITIRYEKNFQRVGSIITVIAKTKDGVIGSKTVRIVSPY